MVALLGNHLWQSTLFACLVAALIPALKRNPAAVRHGLWMAASLKFLIPFSTLIGVGSQMEWPGVPPAAVPAVAAAGVAVERTAEPFGEREPLIPLPSKPGRANRWPAVVFVVWLCGAAANVVAWWRRWRRVREAVRTGAPFAAGWPIRAVSSPARLEPGVFGAFRPVLLLPDGIGEKLTAAQFEAVIEHELCHAQRRDNLAAAIHMLVEALFWFHPLVWWMEARLIEERERACDEAVVEAGRDPQDYAEAIVNVAKFYAVSPLVCVPGVTGANLAARVEAIMCGRRPRGLSAARKLLLTAAGIAAIGVPVGLGMTDAPEITALELLRSGVAFEAVTIRTVRPVGGMIRPETLPVEAGAVALPPTKLGGFAGNRFVMRIGTVKSLLMDAYNVEGTQLEGLPGWAAGGEFFQIHARAKGDEMPGTDEARLMLQAMLADRFHLRAHRETRDVAVYELTPGPGGSKVRQAPDGAAGAERWAWTRLLMQMSVNRPIVDKTGITGSVRAPLDLDSFAGPKGGELMVQWMLDRLGMELKPASQPTEFIVVDDVERPRED